ncbi:stability/partitioning determinant [Methylobacterium sp. SI9]|uniref:stability/partitioning determinant n=1 Tax=Methylobacterium guangdongense TaxID=3138811 RepID=UPI00313D2AEA
MTAGKERASLGFGDELDDIDPSAWAKPKPRNDKPALEVTKQAAEATGFRSREPAKIELALALATPRQQRRRRTGRTAQLNLKLKPETIEAFTRVADAHGWGLGEAFERAVDLLERSKPEN